MLDNLPGGDDYDTYALGVSTDGTIVVGESANHAGEIRAFRRTSSGMEDLGTLRSDNGGNSSAFGVSGNGDIVVGRAEDDHGDMRAFRWTELGMEDLGTLRSDNTGQSVATGISSNGSVIIGDAQIDKGKYFDVYLIHAGPNSTKTIKAVRLVTGLGLAAAKSLVDNAPSLIETNLTKDQVDLYRLDIERYEKYSTNFD